MTNQEYKRELLKLKKVSLFTARFCFWVHLFNFFLALVASEFTYLHGDNLGCLLFMGWAFGQCWLAFEWWKGTKA
jgi:hypothetical protein